MLGLTGRRITRVLLVGAMVPAVAACMTSTAHADHHASHSKTHHTTHPASSATKQSPITGTACQAKDVDLALGHVEPGAGQRAAALIVTAHDNVSCTLRGYPGDLQFLAKDGSNLPTRPQQNSDTPISTVTVTSSSPAHFALHWVGIPAGSGDSGNQSAPYLLKLTLPGNTETSTVRWSGGQTFDGGFLEYRAAQAGADDAGPSPSK